MGRLAQALAKAKRETPRNPAIELARVLRTDYSADIEQMLQAQIESLQMQLRELQAQQHLAVINNISEQVHIAVEAKPIPAPKVIHETPQVTQVIEKPIERIVEKAPTPLVSMHVERDEDNLIGRVRTNKGVFHVKRDKGGYITGVQRA